MQDAKQTLLYADNYMAEFGIAQAPADLTMPTAAAANTNAKANHA